MSKKDQTACLSIGTVFYIIRKLGKKGAPNQIRCMFDLLTICGVNRSNGDMRSFVAEDFQDELLQGNLRRHVSQCINGIIPPVKGDYISFGNADTFSYFLSKCETKLSETLGQLDSFLDRYIGNKTMEEFLCALLSLTEDRSFQSAIESDESLLPYVRGCFPIGSDTSGYAEADSSRLLLLILLYVTKYYIDSPLVKKNIDNWNTGTAFSDWMALAENTYKPIRSIKYRDVSEMTPLPKTLFQVDGQNQSLKTAFSDRRFISYFSEFCALSFCDGINTFTADSLSAYFEAIISEHNLPVFADAFIEDASKNLKVAFHFSDYSDILTLMKKEGDVYSFSHHQIQEYFTAYYFILILPEKREPDLIRQLLAFDRTYAYMDDLFSFMYLINPDKTKAKVYLPVLESIFTKQENEMSCYEHFLTKYCTADLPIPDLGIRMSELVNEIYINNAFPDSAILRTIFRTETTEAISLSMSVKPQKKGLRDSVSLQNGYNANGNITFREGFELSCVDPGDDIIINHPEFLNEDFIPRKVYLTLSDIFSSLCSSISDNMELHTFGLFGRL